MDSGDFPPDAAQGLAWGYFLGFLNIILPGFQDFVSSSKEFGDKIKFKRFFMLMPEDCYCPKSLGAADSRIQHAGNLDDRQLNRAGSVSRNYGKNSVYKFTRQGHSLSNSKQMYQLTRIQAGKRGNVPVVKTSTANAFAASVVMFLLDTVQLLEAYMWCVTFGILFLSGWWNYMYVTYELKQAEQDLDWNFSLHSVFVMLFTVIMQSILALLLVQARQNFGLPKMAVVLSFVSPVSFRLLCFPVLAMQYTPMAALVIPATYLLVLLSLEIKNFLSSIEKTVTWARYVVKHFGLQAFLESQWSRLQVPHVLRVFWLTRLTEQAVYMSADMLHVQYNTYGVLILTFADVVDVMKALMISGCDTIVSLLGMTSVVSRVAHYCGYLVQLFLNSDDQEEQSIGTVSAVLFFILALQTGLVGLDPEKRLQRLYRNMCLLATALMHFFHNIVHPLLMTLSASHIKSVPRHCRAITVCALLMIVPCIFLAYLWSLHTMSTWLLAVSAFCVELIVKVIISLLIYALFCIDACRDTFWEQLDDYVYYIKAIGNTIEFMFGIFLFCNGAWILFFESGGAIRAFMMVIHAYFNIWAQAREGWKTFMKRRTAVRKIRSLPSASAEQLAVINDVCAICYSELNTAVVTQCGHYFHGVCLRKWLYVQDNCPLCHGKVYGSEEKSSSDQPNTEDAPDVPDNRLHPHPD